MAQALHHRDEASAEMAAHVADIEQRLSELDKAFAAGDSELIAQHALHLQRGLAESLVAFRKAEQAGLTPLTDDLRSRLKLAQTRVLAQQAAVNRANASIDRTLSVLFPREESSTYGNLAQTPVSKALNAYR